MGIIASFGASILLFVLLLAAVVGAVALFLNQRMLMGGVLMVLTVILGILWFYSATHRVVPYNKRWIVLNTATQEIVGDVRNPGVTTIPFVTYNIHEYPGAAEQPFCLKYFPALKEGFEIDADICGVYDASQIDWIQQFRSHNFVDEASMLAFWEAQSKENVSLAVQQYDYTTISQHRDQVSNAIRTELQPWFDTEGIPVSQLRLKNWVLTSATVREAIDDASAASYQSTIEQQLLEAATISRERQLYEIETYNMVLAARGEQLSVLFDSLGIEDDNAKAFLAAQLTWSDWLSNPPPGTTVVVGIGNTPVVAPGQAPVVEPAPASP